MSCCGKFRAQASVDAAATTMTQSSRGLHGTVVFKYVGRTRLTVTGPATLTTYVFEGPGAEIAVDSRDSSAIGTIFALRRVR